MTDGSFSLTKWYLDCVTPRGDVVVGYVARVGWGAIALRYASTLVQRAGEATVHRSTLVDAPWPVQDGGCVTWSCPALGVRARFDELAPSAQDILLDGPDGRVDWFCLAPKARAAITLDGAPLEGLGYVERLTLTVPPWRLPIDELRWGRFVADEAPFASLVWIDWRGPHARRVLLQGGAPVADARVSDDGVEGAGGAVRLSLRDPRVLREGALGKTALAILPVAARLPSRILLTEERKWVARGELARGDRRASGWVIHEVVRWP